MIVKMAALTATRRLTSIRGVLWTAVRQTGNSYVAGACALATVHLCTRAHLLGAQPRRWYVDAGPEVDYSTLVPVTREGAKTLSYNAVWLRENCRCDACYVAATCQRAVVYHRLPPEAFVANHVTWASEEGVVEVTWADEHLSR